MLWPSAPAVRSHAVSKDAAGALSDKTAGNSEHSSLGGACHSEASLLYGHGRIFVLDDGHGLVGVTVTNASVHCTQPRSLSSCLEIWLLSTAFSTAACSCAFEHFSSAADAVPTS